MIVAAAVCPHPPLLFRELSGLEDVAGDLREACLSAIASATSDDPDLVVVVGGADVTRTWDERLAPDVAKFGTTGARSAGSGLPLSLGVARRLLDESRWRGAVELHSIAWDAPADEVTSLADKIAARDDSIALLALGDGSARRGDKAPGYLDARAFPFDEATGRALADGDTDALTQMDAALAEELMVGGRAAFAVMATAVHRTVGNKAVVDEKGAKPQATVLYQDDPWGVMYYVATWHLR